MSDNEAVLVERIGHVMVATINRPEARNAVNQDVASGLGHALDDAENDDQIWVFIVTGAGDRAFCAGAVLKALSRGDRREDIFLNDVDRQDLIKTLAEACRKSEAGASEVKSSWPQAAQR